MRLPAFQLIVLAGTPHHMQPCRQGSQGLITVQVLTFFQKAQLMMLIVIRCCASGHEQMQPPGDHAGFS